MLQNYFSYQIRQPAPFTKFNVIDVLESTEADDDFLEYLAHNLVIANVKREFLADAYNTLVGDTQELNLTILKEFLETRVLPDNIIVRVGDFGEILSSCLLTEFEGFNPLVFKLRHREKRNWAVRLTDPCLLKISDDGEPLVCYGEVKTNSSRRKLQLAIEGHESIVKDEALSDPEILKFICGWLYETERFNEKELVLKIWLEKIAYRKRYDLFLVHDAAQWSEEILNRLEAHEVSEQIVDFSVKIVLITNLRDVIDQSYAKTPVAAGVLVT